MAKIIKDNGFISFAVKLLLQDYYVADFGKERRGRIREISQEEKDLKRIQSKKYAIRILRNSLALPENTQEVVETLRVCYSGGRPKEYITCVFAAMLRTEGCGVYDREFYAELFSLYTVLPTLEEEFIPSVDLTWDIDILLDYAFESEDHNISAAAIERIKSIAVSSETQKCDLITRGIIHCIIDLMQKQIAMPSTSGLKYAHKISCIGLIYALVDKNDWILSLFVSHGVLELLVKYISEDFPRKLSSYNEADHILDDMLYLRLIKRFLTMTTLNSVSVGLESFMRFIHKSLSWLVFTHLLPIMMSYLRELTLFIADQLKEPRLQRIIVDNDLCPFSHDQHIQSLRRQYQAPDTRKFMHRDYDDVWVEVYNDWSYFPINYRWSLLVNMYQSESNRDFVRAQLKQPGMKDMLQYSFLLGNNPYGAKCLQIAQEINPDYRLWTKLTVEIAIKGVFANNFFQSNGRDMWRAVLVATQVLTTINQGEPLPAEYEHVLSYIPQGGHHVGASQISTVFLLSIAKDNQKKIKLITLFLSTYAALNTRLLTQILSVYRMPRTFTNRAFTMFPILGLLLCPSVQLMEKYESCGGLDEYSEEKYISLRELVGILLSLVKRQRVEAKRISLSEHFLCSHQITEFYYRLLCLVTRKNQLTEYLLSREEYSSHRLADSIVNELDRLRNGTLWNRAGVQVAWMETLWYANMHWIERFQKLHPHLSDEVMLRDEATEANMTETVDKEVLQIALMMKEKSWTHIQSRRRMRSSPNIEDLITHVNLADNDKSNTEKLCQYFYGININQLSKLVATVEKQSTSDDVPGMFRAPHILFLLTKFLYRFKDEGIWIGGRGSLSKLHRNLKIKKVRSYMLELRGYFETKKIVYCMLDFLRSDAGHLDLLESIVKRSKECLDSLIYHHGVELMIQLTYENRRRESALKSIRCILELCFDKEPEATFREVHSSIQKLFHSSERLSPQDLKVIHPYFSGLFTRYYCRKRGYHDGDFKVRSVIDEYMRHLVQFLIDNDDEQRIGLEMFLQLLQIETSDSTEVEDIIHAVKFMWSQISLKAPNNNILCGLKLVRDNDVRNRKSGQCNSSLFRIILFVAFFKKDVHRVELAVSQGVVEEMMKIFHLLYNKQKENRKRDKRLAYLNPFICGSFVDLILEFLQHSAHARSVFIASGALDVAIEGWVFSKNDPSLFGNMPKLLLTLFDSFSEYIQDNMDSFLSTSVGYLSHACEGFQLSTLQLLNRLLDTIDPSLYDQVCSTLMYPVLFRVYDLNLSAQLRAAELLCRFVDTPSLEICLGSKKALSLIKGAIEYHTLIKSVTGLRAVRSAPEKLAQLEAIASTSIGKLDATTVQAHDESLSQYFNEQYLQRKYPGAQNLAVFFKPESDTVMHETQLADYFMQRYDTMRKLISVTPRLCAAESKHLRLVAVKMLLSVYPILESRHSEFVLECLAIILKQDEPMLPSNSHLIKYIAMIANEGGSLHCRKLLSVLTWRISVPTTIHLYEERGGYGEDDWIRKKVYCDDARMMCRGRYKVNLSINYHHSSSKLNLTYILGVLVDALTSSSPESYEELTFDFFKSTLLSWGDVTMDARQNISRISDRLLILLRRKRLSLYAHNAHFHLEFRYNYQDKNKLTYKPCPYSGRSDSYDSYRQYLFTSRFFDICISVACDKPNTSSVQQLFEEHFLCDEIFALELLQRLVKAGMSADDYSKYRITNIDVYIHIIRSGALSLKMFAAKALSKALCISSPDVILSYDLPVKDLLSLVESSPDDLSKQVLSIIHRFLSAKSSEYEEKKQGLFTDFLHAASSIVTTVSHEISVSILRICDFISLSDSAGDQLPGLQAMTLSLPKLWAATPPSIVDKVSQSPVKLYILWLLGSIMLKYDAARSLVGKSQWVVDLLEYISTMSLPDKVSNAFRIQRFLTGFIKNNQHNLSLFQKQRKLLVQLAKIKDDLSPSILSSIIKVERINKDAKKSLGIDLLHQLISMPNYDARIELATLVAENKPLLRQARGFLRRQKSAHKPFVYKPFSVPDFEEISCTVSAYSSSQLAPLAHMLGIWEWFNQTVSLLLKSETISWCMVAKILELSQPFLSTVKWGGHYLTNEAINVIIQACQSIPKPHDSTIESLKKNLCHVLVYFPRSSVYSPSLSEFLLSILKDESAEIQTQQLAHRMILQCAADPSHMQRIIELGGGSILTEGLRSDHAWLEQSMSIYQMKSGQADKKSTGQQVCLYGEFIRVEHLNFLFDLWSGDNKRLAGLAHGSLLAILTHMPSTVVDFCLQFKHWLLCHRLLSSDQDRQRLRAIELIPVLSLSYQYSVYEMIADLSMLIDILVENKPKTATACHRSISHLLNHCDQVQPRRCYLHHTLRKHYSKTVHDSKDASLTFSVANEVYSACVRSFSKRLPRFFLLKSDPAREGVFGVVLQFITTYPDACDYTSGLVKFLIDFECKADTSILKPIVSKMSSELRQCYLKYCLNADKAQAVFQTLLTTFSNQDKLDIINHAECEDNASLNYLLSSIKNPSMENCLSVLNHHCLLVKQWFVKSLVHENFYSDAYDLFRKTCPYQLLLEFLEVGDSALQVNTMKVILEFYRTRHASGLVDVGLLRVVANLLPINASYDLDAFNPDEEFARECINILGPDGESIFKISFSHIAIVQHHLLEPLISLYLKYDNLFPSHSKGRLLRLINRVFVDDAVELILQTNMSDLLCACYTAVTNKKRALTLVDIASKFEPVAKQLIQSGLYQFSSDITPTYTHIHTLINTPRFVAGFLIDGCVDLQVWASDLLCQLSFKDEKRHEFMIEHVLNHLIPCLNSQNDQICENAQMIIRCLGHNNPDYKRQLKAQIRLHRQSVDESTKPSLLSGLTSSVRSGAASLLGSTQSKSSLSTKVSDCSLPSGATSSIKQSLSEPISADVVSKAASTRSEKNSTGSSMAPRGVSTASLITQPMSQQLPKQAQRDVTSLQSVPAVKRTESHTVTSVDKPVQRLPKCQGDDVVTPSKLPVAAASSIAAPMPSTSTVQANATRELCVIPRSGIVYDVDKDHIGVGSFAHVYKGIWNNAQGAHIVAIKVLKAQGVSQDALSELKSEGELISRLNHPNIMSIHGVCLQQGYYSLVMEYMPDRSLYGVLHNQSIAISWAQRYQISKGITAGVAFLHDYHVLHRDLKSLNVLMRGLEPKISDFGLAKIKSETMTLTKATGGMTGTLAWMAPELMMSPDASYVKSCDIYSLGILLFEIASREDPWKDAAVSSLIIAWVIQGLRPQIPADTPTDFAKLISSCWAQDPKDRPTASVVNSAAASLSCSM